MKILGIDPGLKGAFCLFDQNTQTITNWYRMPKTSQGVNLTALCDIIKSFVGQVDLVNMEKVGAFHGGSRKSAFTFGYNVGIIEVLLVQNQLPYRLIPPKVWQKGAHIGIDKTLNPKIRSTLAAKRLWPGFNGLSHDGVVDAALIARFGGN